MPGSLKERSKHGHTHRQITLALLAALENTHAWLYPQTTQHHWSHIRFAVYRLVCWNYCCSFLFCLLVTPVSRQLRGFIPGTDCRSSPVGFVALVRVYCQRGAGCFEVSLVSAHPRRVNGEPLILNAARYSHHWTCAGIG